MNDDERRAAFAQAFYSQARSDWQIYHHLSGASVKRCHVLHYLQMASEKIAKAYRIRDLAASVDDLARHHTGFSEFVNQYMNSKILRGRYKGKDASREATRKQLHSLAVIVERLAPAIDNLQTPENAEYPWERNDKVFTPCEFEYPALDFLTEPGGRSLLKIIEDAITHYESIHVT